MDLTERVIFMLLGGAVGFVFGYIVRSLRDIKEEVHEVKERAVGPDADNHKRDERGEMRMPSFQTLALAVVVFLVAYAAFVSQSASNKVEDQAQQNLVAQCQSGVDSRTAQRKIIDAIYELAIGSIQRDEDAPPLTKMELAQYNAYIDRVNTFRENTYKLIKPSEVCAPYVDDDVVKPPTPPQPHITR